MWSRAPADALSRLPHSFDKRDAGIAAFGMPKPTPLVTALVWADHRVQGQSTTRLHVVPFFEGWSIERITSEQGRGCDGATRDTASSKNDGRQIMPLERHGLCVHRPLSAPVNAVLVCGGGVVTVKAQEETKKGSDFHLELDDRGWQATCIFRCTPCVLERQRSMVRSSRTSV